MSQKTAVEQLGAIVNIGACIGALLGAILVENIGRRNALASVSVCVSLLHEIGWKSSTRKKNTSQESESHDYAIIRHQFQEVLGGYWSYWGMG